MKTALWNIVFAVFFVIIVLMGVSYLGASGLLARPLAWGDFILMALAVWRLVRLMSYDVITQFIRDSVAHKRAGTFLGTLSALIHCPWCTGLWFGFLVVFFFYVSPLAAPIILILALAAVGSFFQILANLIGWHAEGKKREVLGPGATSKTTCG